VGPLRVALPFQTVETVNESAQDRQRSLLLGPGFREEAWRNRLIWGDKKYVIPSLLAEFAGKVNLIYIDPPFDTGADFSFMATVPDDPDSEEDDSFKFTKEPSIIEHKAYRDTWGRGLESYLQWFYETVVLLHELLHENGTICVHLDWHCGHYAKLVMDEVFNKENLLNEVIWHYKRWPTPAREWQKMHDTLLCYVRSRTLYTFNKMYGPRTEETQKRWKDKRIVASHSDTGRRIPSQSEDEASQGAPLDDVWDISIVAPVAHERRDYPTQKPEGLLLRQRHNRGGR